MHSEGWLAGNRKGGIVEKWNERAIEPGNHGIVRSGVPKYSSDLSIGFEAGN